MDNPFQLPLELFKKGQRLIFNKRQMVLVSVNGSAYCPILEHKAIKLFYSADEIQTALEIMKTKIQQKNPGVKILLDFIIFEELSEGQY
jgi:hypothetical protein